MVDQDKTVDMESPIAPKDCVIWTESGSIYRVEEGDDIDYLRIFEKGIADKGGRAIVCVGRAIDTVRHGETEGKKIDKIHVEDLEEMVGEKLRAGLYAKKQIIHMNEGQYPIIQNRFGGDLTKLADYMNNPSNLKNVIATFAHTSPLHQRIFK